MLDVKELFTPKRKRLLRGEPEATTIPFQALPLSWRRFPDPAASALLQNRACQAWEVLGTCEAALLLCKADLRSSRDVLRQCRTQLEAHLACSSAVCDLLAGRWSDPQDADWASDTICGRPAATCRPKHCVGRVRCFFCRERDSLEQGLDGATTTRDRWELDSAVLGDVSCTASDSSDGFHFARGVSEEETQDSDQEQVVASRRLVRRRKTSRERGRPLYKLKRKEVANANVSSTWYATHTVEPPRMASQSPTEKEHSGSAGGSQCSPVLSRESSGRKPEALLQLKAEVWDLKTSALQVAGLKTIDIEAELERPHAHQ